MIELNTSLNKIELITPLYKIKLNLYKIKLNL